MFLPHAVEIGFREGLREGSSGTDKLIDIQLLHNTLVEFCEKLPFEAC